MICESTSGTSLLVLQGSGSGSESGAIVNGGAINILSLVKTGSGVWNLSGQNTYSGTTGINGGMLILSGSSGSIAQSAALTVSGGTLQLDDSALAANFSSSRLGRQPITLHGGLLSLNLGGVSGGTETIGSLAAATGENELAIVGSGGGVLSAGSLSRMSGATLNFSGSLSATNAVTLSIASSGSTFINAGTFVNGANYAVYDASGYVRAMVAGSNAWDYAYDPSTAGMASRHVLLDVGGYSAESTLTMLTLSLSGASTGFSLASSQTLTLTDGGILKTGGGTAVVGGGTGLATGVEYVFRADTTSDVLAINAPITGGTGLTKSGLGVLVLGSSANSYGGPTTIAAGTLQTAVAGAIPSTSPLVIDSAAALDLAGHTQTLAGFILDDGSIMNSGPAAVLTLGSSAAGVTYAGVGGGSSISGGTLNLAAPLSPSASIVFAIGRGQGNVDLNVAADIADGSVHGQTLVKTGNGILELSGTNSFSGGIQILAGEVTLGSNSAVPAAAGLTLSAGTLNLGGNANTAASLLVEGGLVAGNGSLSAATFNLQGGTIAACLAGSGAVSVATTGTVTVTGSNSYSGGTALSSGVLAVTADNSLGASAGALTLNGGTLDVLGTSFNSTSRSINLTANGGGIAVADPGDTLTLASQDLSGSGAFSKGGQGCLKLGGSIGSAAITVEDGVLQLIGTASQLTAQPSLSLWNVATFALGSNNESVSMITLTGGTINTGTATLSLSGSLNYAQTIWPATIAGNLALGTAAGQFQISYNASSCLTVAANLSGAPVGGLVKSDSGIMLLSGSNTYSGGTTVLGGALMAATTASLPGYSSSGAVAVAPNAVLGVLTGNGATGWNTSQINTLVASVDWVEPAYLGIETSNGNFTYGGTLPGALGLVKLGDNTLTVSASNTYSGATVISAGTLQAGVAGAIPSTSPLVIESGAALDIAGHNQTLAGITLDDGVIVNSSTAAVLTLANSGTAVTYNGVGNGSSISGGTLNLARPGSPSARIGFDITRGSGNADLNLAVDIVDGSANSQTLLKTGDGILELSGTDSYTGGTAVADGTLDLFSPAALPDKSNLIVGAGGTFLFDPTIDAAPLAAPEPGALPLLLAVLSAMLTRNWVRHQCQKLVKVAGGR